MSTDSEATVVPEHESTQLTWTVLAPAIPAKPPVLRLYGSPPIIDGEIPSSWVHRIAARHGLRPGRVGQLLGWRRELSILDFAKCPPSFKKLAYITLNDVSAIASGFARSRLLLRENTSHFMVHHANGFALYRVCVRCLEEDPVPYIRAHWRLAYSVFCERHREALIDHCHACSCRLGLDSREHTDLPVQVRDRALCYCSECWTRLADTKPAPIPPVLLPLLSNFQQLVYRTITRGYQRHPVYGTISATKLLRSFATETFVRIEKPRNDGTCHARNSKVDQIDWLSIIGVPHYEIFREWLSGSLTSLYLLPSYPWYWRRTNDD